MIDTPALYDRRLVAYIDIIGWSEACRNPTKHALVAKVARRLSEVQKNFSRNLKTILTTTPGVPVDPSHERTEVVAFSDNLAISTSIDVDPNIFFKFISFMCRELLTSGFLMRGGVTVGDLVHVENMIFGPALIDAVILEKEAIFPRLLCSPTLVGHIKGCSRLPTVIIHDQLGRPILNILVTVNQSNPVSWGDIEKKINDSITEMIDNHAPEKHLEKWRFMRDVLPRMINAAPA
jgi:hypothetical protein